MTDYQSILDSSAIPPALRAMMPTAARARTPEESLDVLCAVIEGLAQRTTDAGSLTIQVERDQHGATIRIDLPR